MITKASITVQLPVWRIRAALWLIGLVAWIPVEVPEPVEARVGSAIGWWIKRGVKVE